MPFSSGFLLTRKSAAIRPSRIPAACATTDRKMVIFAPSISVRSKKCCGMNAQSNWAFPEPALVQKNQHSSAKQTTPTNGQSRRRVLELNSIQVLFDPPLGLDSVERAIGFHGRNGRIDRIAHWLVILGSSDALGSGVKIGDGHLEGGVELRVVGGHRRVVQGGVCAAHAQLVYRVG